VTVIGIPKVVVYGASGFVGRHLVREGDMGSFSFISRRGREVHPEDSRHANWMVADLLSIESTERVLEPRCTVINLAYSRSSSPGVNILMMKNLSEACHRKGVSRLIHCSTAVVVGNSPALHVNEKTESLPATVYEKTKYDIESVLLNTASDELKVYILRPTEIIGPGGQNLKKLLLSIQVGNCAVNYVRSSVYGKRIMNLVPVKDVVGALNHLCKPLPFLPGIYICSADDDPDNRYDRIEEIMRRLLNKPTGLKSIPLPIYILKAVLYSLRNGAGRFVNRTYSPEKLFQTGFQRRHSISEAVEEFVLSETRPSRVKLS